MAVALPSLSETITQPPEPFPVIKIQQSARPGNVTPHPPNSQRFGKTRLRIDPQRALEPARKKLTSLEAQRIMAVINESVKRLELISVLPSIIENIEQYQIPLGTDLVKLLQNHQAVISSFNELKETVEKFISRDEDKSGKYFSKLL